MARIGDRIASYELTEVLASGAMGTVFKARDSRLNRDVALKLLAQDLSQNVVFRTRFQRESTVAGGLRHPNIVPVFDAGEWMGQLYLAMLLVEGPSLAAVISRKRNLPTKRVVSIVSQVAGALDAAHAQGIIHRDVKPGNILLLEGGGAQGSDHVYLVDFGITRTVDAAASITRTGMFMGTLSYIAPEQLAAGAVDGRADQYALAGTAFEMLTSSPPFVRDNEAALTFAQLNSPAPLLSAVRPDLPAALTPVLLRGLAKDPRERFPSSSAFADALATAAAKRDEQVAPPLVAPAPAIAAPVAAAPVAAAPVAAAPVAAPDPDSFPTVRDLTPAYSRPVLPSRRRAAKRGRGWMPLVAGLLAGGLVVLLAYAAYAVLFAPGPDRPGESTPPVAVSSPTVLPTTTVGVVLPSAGVTPAPTDGIVATPTPPGQPTRTPRSTRRPTATPTTTTPTPTPSPTPTATATATASPPSSLPIAAAGTWAVVYSLTSTEGQPPTALGDHTRRYDIEPDCPSESDCRMLVTSYDGDGDFVGNIRFTWNGSAYRYAGAARYYSRAGGSACTPPSGETLPGAYTTREVVTVEPSRRNEAGEVVEFTGTKRITGTPTPSGTANGCEPYSLTYAASLTR
jgi:serine/threonine-protein kinase